MGRLSHLELISLTLSLGLLLAAARLLGELARRLKQPAILGEVLAGVLLGPTVLAHLAPDFHTFLFPSTGPLATCINAIATVSVLFFLLAAGLEIDLSRISGNGKSVLRIAVSGFFIPLCAGTLLAVRFPALFGFQEHPAPWISAMFFGLCLSISALPVIAKTLLDLGLYRSTTGTLMMAAATVTDIMCWLFVAVIFDSLGQDDALPFPMPVWIAAIMGIVLTAVALGRVVCDSLLSWASRNVSSRSVVLTLMLALTLIVASFSEWIGLHGVLGAFLLGVALGDSDHLDEASRKTLTQQVNAFFAPIFFASIGLRVDAFSHFDLYLAIIVFISASLAKVLSVALGARWSKLPSKQMWALAFGMNARGAMEIVLAVIALEAGIIAKPLFVALVVMALLTTMASGPLIQHFLRDTE